MRTGTLHHLACPVPACRGALEHLSTVEVTGTPDETLEAVLQCTRCAAEYPVLMGVAILEVDLPGYLAAFWSGIESCSAGAGQLGISPRMCAWLGVPEAFTGRTGPPPEPEPDRSASPYLQSHLDPASLLTDLPAGWWRDAVQAHGRGEEDPYAYLLGAAESALRERGAGLSIDVGCSTGRGAAGMARWCDFALGVDRSFPAVLAARQALLGSPAPLGSYQVQDEKGRWRTREMGPLEAPANLDFVVAAAGELPVANGAASCVGALNVLCAVRDPGSLVESFARVLSPGGLLLLATPFWADDDEAGESPFASGGPPGLHLMLGEAFRVAQERDMVPWLLRLAKRRWNVYLSHCVVAVRQ